MRLPILLTLLLTPLAALADIKFTHPAAGDSIPAGQLTVKWTDDGQSPSLEQLATYTLTLVTGGNREDDALQLMHIGGDKPSSFSEGYQATGIVDEKLATTLENGFYLKMLSTAQDGGTITTYSDRFTITGLTGYTPIKNLQAVRDLGGSTTSPENTNDLMLQARAQPAGQAAPAAGAAPAGAAVGAAAPAAAAPAAPAADAQFNVPYNQQTGPTKYAPMQPVPPTKITKKGKPTPLYPSSHFTIANGWMPPATAVVSTVTDYQTFSVHSMENTASPAPNPKDDMKRFMARWKD